MMVNRQEIGPIDLAARPRKNWPAHVTRLLEGNVIYVDPHDFAQYTFERIDLLALLWDRVIINSPREYLFAESAYQSAAQTTYPLDRFLDMVERGIFIPYDWEAAVNDKRAGRAGAYWQRGQFRRILDSGNYIIREEITRSTRFNNYCSPLVEHDSISAELRNIIQNSLPELPLDDANLNLRPGTVSEVQRRLALHLNWGGTLAQLLGAEMFIHPRLRSVWEYKTEYLSAQNDQSAPGMALRAFVDRLHLDLPANMPVHDIAEFRATVEASHFRHWIASAFRSAREQSSEVPLEERVYLEFQRLCDAHQRRNDVVVSRVTGLASTIISSAIGLMINGPMGAALSGVAGLGLGEVLKGPATKSSRLLKRQIGGDWTFFFIEQHER